MSSVAIGSIQCGRGGIIPFFDRFIDAFESVSVSHQTIDLVAMLRQGIADDSGQDVIEYALLGAIIGIASVLTWQLLATTVGDVYSAADADVQESRRARRIRAAAAV